MAEVDPASGLPKSMVEEQKAENYDRLMARKGRADQLNDDLQSERGQIILNKIQEHLLSRVNFLMDNDGECKALKKVLIDMGLTLNIGKVAIDNLMRMVLKK